MPASENETLLKDINVYLASLKAGVQAAVELELGPSRERLAKRMADLERQKRWQDAVERPAMKLVTLFLVPNLWSGRIPASAKEAKIEEIKALVAKAEAGDKIAQAVLTRGHSLLEEKKVDVTKFPSLHWIETDPISTK